MEWLKHMAIWVWYITEKVSGIKQWTTMRRIWRFLRILGTSTEWLKHMAI